MTIADALRAVAPPAAAATDEEFRVRQTALELVYTELHRLARARCANTEDAEDVASHLACAIADAGPREPHASPPTDAQARAYLAKAVRNRLIDRYRAVQRLTIADDLDRFPGSTHSDTTIDDEARMALLHEAERVLYDEAVPALARDASGRFDRDGFVEAVQQLRAIHRGGLTVDALLLAADGRVTAAGRNRLYKQHERARSRVLECLPRWLAARPLTAPVAMAVRQLAAIELAARVTRGAES